MLTLSAVVLAAFGRNYRTSDEPIVARYVFSRERVFGSLGSAVVPALCARYDRIAVGPFVERRLVFSRRDVFRSSS